MTEYISLKNIIFDLGNVILNVDYSKSLDAFHRLGFVNFEATVEKLKADQVFNHIETGKLRPEGFRNELRKYTNIPVTDNQLDEAWNAMLLDFPKNRIHKLIELSKKYKLFLLSNTNEIHTQCFNKSFAETFGFPDFDCLFEMAYYSQRIHLRKPDPKIYEKVLNDNMLQPNKTLFIDDLLVNIEAAQALGIHCHHLLPEEELVDVLDRITTK